MDTKGKMAFSLGLGAVYAWTWIPFYSSVVFPFEKLAFFEVGVLLIAWMIGRVTTFAFFSTRTLQSTWRTSKIVSAIALLGTLLAVLAFNQPVISPVVLASVSTALLGFSRAMLVILWGNRYSLLEYFEIQRITALAIGLCAAVLVVTVFIENFIAILIFLALPFVSALFLKQTALSSTEQQQTLNKPAKGMIPRTLLIFMLVYSFANSYIRGTGDSAIIGEQWFVSLALFGGIIIAALLIQAIESLKVVYQASTLLMAAGLMLLPFSITIPGVTFIGVAWVSFEIINWVLLAALSKRDSLNPSLVFSRMWLVIDIGMTLGTITGLGIILDPSTPLATIIPLVLAYLVLFALSLATEKPFMYIVEKEVQIGKIRTAYDSAITASALEYGLTSREKEILRLVAYGRNTKYIQGKLYITTNTIKTHLKHIYAKMGVGTRQELLDAIEIFLDSKQS